MMRLLELRDVPRSGYVSATFIGSARYCSILSFAAMQLILAHCIFVT